MSVQRIAELLSKCATKERIMPPTALYNEGWMLRLVLDWFSNNRQLEHKLQFALNSRWYSELLLKSPFLPRTRGDSLGESYTHADGVIGHFDIGKKGKGDILLLDPASQLIVTEAKMFSGLAKGTTRALTYDQASRNVACIADIVGHPDRLESLGHVGLYILAPESQESSIRPYLDKTKILATVQARVSAYEGERDAWFEQCFKPI